jgi:hypothetical protein
MEKILNFSEPFLTVEYISSAEDYYIANKAIIINIDLDPTDVEDVELQPMHSMLCANTTIAKVRNLLLVTVANDNFLNNNRDIDADIIRNSWHHVHDLFDVPQLRESPLWRSQKERIRNLELNLWFAPAGTHCGIHKKHNFFEVHTQLYGIGSMQKFHRKSHASLYQETMMAPGYTHEPFYNSLGEYPWHQYHADTDCIWMAIEQH